MQASHGLPFSSERKFFEPKNRVLMDMQIRGLRKAVDERDTQNNIGAGDGI
jgi:hypothetical protein